jgi:3-dehydroquinate synthetase
MKAIQQYTVIRKSETLIAEAENWEEIIAFIRTKYVKVLWVIDKKVRPLIPLDSHDTILEIDGGDKSKSFAGFESLVKALADMELDRTGHIVAVGGGSISDLVGYVASVYLRGISFSIIPSTLLSLIDASMGGKNGINYVGKKNQLGTIYQPSTIIYIPELIAHLPIDELADGFAEIIKYGLILDQGLFAKLEESNLEKIIGNQVRFSEIINSCIIHKSNIIKEDPFEYDLRRILNYGHTIGHAIESIYGLSHGKAVGLGMYFSAKLSEIIYGSELQLAKKIRQILPAYHLPIRLEVFSANDIFEKIISDKKRENDNIHFVLLEKIGRAHVEKIPMDRLMEYLNIAEREKWMC